MNTPGATHAQAEVHTHAHPRGETSDFFPGICPPPVAEAPEDTRSTPPQ